MPTDVALLLLGIVSYSVPKMCIRDRYFTIAPDKDAIEKNMERAFQLCDKSAFNYYKDLAEKGYYNRAISGNVNQRIEID